MKAINVNENSWHHYLANYGDSCRDMHDICSYARAVMSGTMLLTLSCALAIGAIVGLADFVAWMIAMIVTWSFIHIGGFASIGLGLILGLVLGFCGNKFINRKKSEKVGFISIAYSSWKNKWCAPVVITRSES